MLQSQSLGLEEADRAIEAGIAAAQKLGRPMAFAVTDAAAGLIAAVRMNGAHARILQHSIRKAYTSATMGRNTLSFKADLEERDGSLDQWGDADLTTLPGGYVVASDGATLGAIGAGGGGPHDEEVAAAMVRAIGFVPVEDKRVRENKTARAGART